MTSSCCSTSTDITIASIFVLGSKPDHIIFIVAKHGVVISSIAALEVTRIIQALPAKPIMVAQKQKTKEDVEKQREIQSKHFGNRRALLNKERLLH